MPLTILRNDITPDFDPAANTDAVEGFYGVPAELRERCLTFLSEPLREILLRFDAKFSK